jgi:hypothetical protein
MGSYTPFASVMPQHLSQLFPPAAQLLHLIRQWIGGKNRRQDVQQLSSVPIRNQAASHPDQLEMTEDEYRSTPTPPA